MSISRQRGLAEETSTRVDRTGASDLIPQGSGVTWMFPSFLSRLFELLTSHPLYDGGADFSQAPAKISVRLRPAAANLSAQLVNGVECTTDVSPP